MPIRLSEIEEQKPIRLSDVQGNKSSRLVDVQINNDLSNSTWDNTKKISFDDMSKFGKTLDIIGRPGQAIKSMLNESLKVQELAFNKAGLTEVERRDVNNPKRTEVIRSIKIPMRQHSQNLLKAAWRGLSGQERHTANELWKKQGIQDVPLLGFATEIATDPLMYGGYSAATKAISKAIKVVGKLPPVAKATTAISTRVKPAATALKELFINKTGIGKLNTLIDKHLNLKAYRGLKEFRFSKKFSNVIANISKKTGQSVDDIEKQIISFVEQPQKAVPGMSQDARVLANTMREHLSNMLTREMKAGVPIASIGTSGEIEQGITRAQGLLNKLLERPQGSTIAVNKVMNTIKELRTSRAINYFPRITSKEAMEYMKNASKSFGLGSKVWNPKIANAIKRKTKGFTLQEFNDFVAEHGAKSLGGKSVEQFFMKQPHYASYVRGIRSAKAVSSGEFLDDVARTFGNKNPTPGAVELPADVLKLNKKLVGKYFDPEVAKEVGRVTTAYFNPKEAKLFGKVFDTIQNAWKRWTLAPFPKYHLRNMVGNTWNNYLAGVGPDNYVKAQALQLYRKYGKSGGNLGRLATKELQKLGITPQMADDIITNAEKSGVLGRGWFSADIEVAFGEGGSKLQKVLELGKPGKFLTEKGMAVGSTIENNARLAHFIDRLGKGDDVLNAAHSVKKFLFDYTDLTPFERDVMKRIMPFYTWTRKNVPLQLEQLWKQPEKFAPILPALRSRDPKDLLRLKYTRPQIYERLPIELKRDIDTVTYVPLEGLIPAADLTKMARPQEMMLELITPYLRAPIELMMNKSFYFESEIKKYDNQTQEFIRMDIPVKLKYALTTVIPQARMLNEINKLVRKEVRGEKLTPGEQAFSQSLSSIYKVNLKDLRKRALLNVRKKVQDLQRGAFWAKRNNRLREYERIKATYEEMKSTVERLK